MAEWSSASGVGCSAEYQTWSRVNGAREALPINCVSWTAAFAFCIWDGGFLPSATELNYARAGGGEQRLYPWGDTEPATDAELAVYGCYYGGGDGTCSGTPNIAPAGAISGAGRWGQYDLSGNVFEWVVDYTGTGPAECDNCAVLTEASDHVKIGGSFSNGKAYLGTSGSQTYAKAATSREIGVRCARPE